MAALAAAPESIPLPLSPTIAAPESIPLPLSPTIAAPESIPLPLSPPAVAEPAVADPPYRRPNSPPEHDEILHGGLTPEEEPWAARHDFLKECGYLLRPRYRPGWKPSWTTYNQLSRAEDGIVMSASKHLLDAIRISDSKPVYLKVVSKSSSEITITRLLGKGDLSKDPRNHAVPLLDILEDVDDPEHAILVLPLLRRLDSPGLASIREGVALIEQTLEGLAFLHEHSVAHRDSAWGNIMMDARAMFPEGWHPQGYERKPDGQLIKNSSPSRTAVGGVRYFFIDFGLSSLREDSTVGFSGQERAPELSYDVPYDPYKLDVYVLGMAYKQLLVDLNSGVDFVKPLIAYMTLEAPEDRPTAAEAVERFQLIRSTMTETQLSQRLWPLKPEWIGIRIIKDAYYRYCDRRWTKKPKKELEPFV
ncbi:hypothetical protein FRB94_013099 [Tulasnella sp. JGI-2019a]|nr:hypothetical protein FRB94_013099 [Tulasnella sp. JGI-2019a]KAG9023363.1 hypothetical protein FRB95_013195 [Tulasnella sp. JGI-2019a]